MSIYKEISNLIQHDIDSTTDALSRGAANDYAEYQYMVGKVEGLYHSMALIKDILTKNLDEVEMEDY